MVSIDSEGSKVSFLIGTTTTSPQNEHNFHPNPSHFFSFLKQGYIPKCLITSDDQRERSEIKGSEKNTNHTKHILTTVPIL